MFAELNITSLDIRGRTFHRRDDKERLLFTLWAIVVVFSFGVSLDNSHGAEIAPVTIRRQIKFLLRDVDNGVAQAVCFLWERRITLGHIPMLPVLCQCCWWKQISGQRKAIK